MEFLREPGCSAARSPGRSWVGLVSKVTKWQTLRLAGAFRHPHPGIARARASQRAVVPGRPGWQRTEKTTAVASSAGLGWAGLCGSPSPSLLSTLTREQWSRSRALLSSLKQSSLGLYTGSIHRVYKGDHSLLPQDKCRK